MRRFTIVLTMFAAFIAIALLLIPPDFPAENPGAQVIEDVPIDSGNFVPDSARTVGLPQSDILPFLRESQDAVSPPVPPEALTWAADHGYQTYDGKTSSDQGYSNQHPYNYYDQETLEKLAKEGDGQAQLILAESLYFSDLQRADTLFIEAAINGKTAGLVHAAASRQVSFPGQEGFGFPLVNEGGIVSSDYLDVLRFYAAAEILGDFVGTEMLSFHVGRPPFRNSSESMQRICASGRELANEIVAQRIQRWGSSNESEVPFEWAEIAEPVCRKRWVLARRRLTRAIHGPRPAGALRESKPIALPCYARVPVAFANE